MSSAHTAPAITFQRSQLQSELVEHLRDFTTMMRSIEVRQVMGKEAIKELPRFDRQVRQHLEEPFHLVVLGDFKRGKSTLINALLGEAAVTTDVRPETVTINSIDYGPELRVTARLENGGEVTLRAEDLKRESLAPILQRLSSPVQKLRISMPSEFLRELTVVDTPGLGDLFKQFDATVSDYLHNADAIIHVISAVSPLSQGEQDYLRTAVAPQNFPKMVFVVNMLDALPSEKDCERVLALVQSKIGALFPNSAVFGVSGLDEWCREQNKPRPNPPRADALAARFRQFRNHLDQAILFNRALISSQRAAQAFENMLSTYTRKVDMLKEAMQVDRRRLSESIATFENRNVEFQRFFDDRSRQLEQGIADLAEQARCWMSEYVDRLENESIGKLPEHRYEDVKKHFQFFMVDSLRAAFEKCLRTHQDALTELMEAARQDLAKNIAISSLTTGRSLELSAPRFSDLPWTGMDTLHLADMMVFGAGTLIGILLGHVHNVKEQSQTGKLAAMMRDQVPKLREDVLQQTTNIYSQIGADMIRELRAAHENDLQSSLESMKQAQELQTRDEASKAETERVMKVLEESLHSDVEFVQGYTEKLWSGSEAVA